MDKKEIAREKIITEAGKVFGKLGFKKTHMATVAREAGMGKSSLYYYFLSKEELFEAVIDREAKYLKEEIIKATSEVSDPCEKLKAYVFARMKAFNRSINLYNAVRTNYLSHLPFIDKVRSKYEKEEKRMVSNILKDGARKKIFIVPNNELATIAIVTAIKGLEMPLLLRKDAADIERQADQLLTFLFYGITKGN